ncbi:type IV pilus modification protein PilV [Algiphilus sp.]|uniref:type IV pilus modification protein PilV n=1 Tax=Algiphilus sp. TaxID=1872431 RepID=UPI003B517575
MSGRRMHARGLTLIEVLIAVVVLSLGLLGVAAMQGSAVRNTFVADQYAVASMHSQSIAERMRANRIGLMEGHYALAAGSEPPKAGVDCASADCNAEELAVWDLGRWKQAVTGGTDKVHNGPPPLPASSVSIVCTESPCDALSPYSIAICWDPERGAQGDEDICLSLAVAP